MEIKFIKNKSMGHSESKHAEVTSGEEGEFSRKDYTSTLHDGTEMKFIIELEVDEADGAPKETDDVYIVKVKRKGKASYYAIDKSSPGYVVQLVSEVIGISCLMH